MAVSLFVAKKQNQLGNFLATVHGKSRRETRARQEETSSRSRRNVDVALHGLLLRSPLVLNCVRAMSDALRFLQRHADAHFRSFQPHVPRHPLPLPSLPFARITPQVLAAAVSAQPGGDAVAQDARKEGMTPEQVARRLEGIPVYTVANANNEFVVISDLKGAKSLVLFCFREEDAAALLTQVRERDPSLGRGARVAPVSLDKVYLLAAEGLAFRFLPDPNQVRHAVKIVQAQTVPAKQGKGDAAPVNKRFFGVPIFQSENLILRSKNQRYVPAFFSKDDLDLALQHATRQKKRVNPKMGPGAGYQIQVGSLENTLKELEANDEDSVWGSLVFVPPGVDAQAHISKKS